MHELGRMKMKQGLLAEVMIQDAFLVYENNKVVKYIIEIKQYQST